MFKLLLTIFVLWLLYKLVFEFILPVYHSTKQVRQQMGDIQERMRQQYQQQQQAQQQAAAREQQQQAARKHADKGDYIDFEEVK